MYAKYLTHLCWFLLIFFQIETKIALLFSSCDLFNLLGSFFLSFNTVTIKCHLLQRALFLPIILENAIAVPCNHFYSRKKNLILILLTEEDEEIRCKRRGEKYREVKSSKPSTKHSYK